MAAAGSCFRVTAVVSLAALLFIAATPAAQADDVNRWVDDRGKVHFSNHPKHLEKKTDGDGTPGRTRGWTDSRGRKIYSDRSPESAVEERRRIQRQMECRDGVTEIYTGPAATEAGRVVLLTARWCASSRSARDYLRKNSIRFTEYDIDRHRAGRVLYGKLPRRGVPAIVAGNLKMVGFRADLADDVLRRSGHLPALQK